MSKFIAPDNLSELMFLGKKNPCGQWAMKDFWELGKYSKQMHCILPYDHEYELGLPHISEDWDRAWREGFQWQVWHKDKSLQEQS